MLTIVLINVVFYIPFQNCYFANEWSYPALALSDCLNTMILSVNLEKLHGLHIHCDYVYTSNFRVLFCLSEKPIAEEDHVKPYGLYFFKDKERCRKILMHAFLSKVAIFIWTAFA